MKFINITLIIGGLLTNFAAGCFLIYSKNNSAADLLMTATLFTKIMNISGQIGTIVHVIADFE